MLSSQKVHTGKSWLKLISRAFRRNKLRLFFLSLLFIGIFRKRRKIPTSIIYSLNSEQVFYNSSPQQVLNFFREERFSSRANFLEPIIEVRSIRTVLLRNRYFTFDASLYILHKVLLRSDYLGIFRSVNSKVLMIDHPSSFKLKSFKESLLDPILYTLLFSRFGNSIDLVTTQSSLFKLPSSFKVVNAPRRIMAWYSTNSKPIYASQDEVRRQINLSAIKEYISEHWVWNHEEVDFFESQGLKGVIAVGPIIFQDIKLEGKDLDKFIITYFDVTPHERSSDFYSEKNTIQVLNTVLRLFDSLNSRYPGRITLQLKPKRRYVKLHSKKYVSLLGNYSKLQKLRILPASTNLYEIVSKSDLVLAIPFTSPAILSKYLKVKSFFISIGIEGWDVDSSSGGVPVIFQFESLLQEIEKDVISKFTNETN